MLTDALTVLDQPVAKGLGNNYFMDLADRVIGQSLMEGSFDVAFSALDSFRAVNKGSSLAICRLLHGVNLAWEKIESEETFIQQAMRKTGYSQLTIERYIAVWELLTGNYVPDEFLDNLRNQTMRQLVKEASLVVEQKYELEHDDWRDLSEAIDENRVAEVCSKIKGKPRNKNHMSLKIGEDGWITAYQDGQEEHVGQLFIESESELVQKAVRRIMSSSGVTKRNEY